MKRFTALLIGMLLLLMAGAQAYAGSGYNRMYWRDGQYLGNGIDLYGHGSYEPYLRYGGGAYDWQSAYRSGTPYYSGALRPYGYAVTNSRYGYGTVSPRYGYGVISPRYGYNFQSPRGYWN